MKSTPLFVFRLTVLTALLTALLLASSAVAASPIEQHARSTVGKQAASIYVFSKKVGYVLSETRLTTLDGRPALLTRSDSLMRISVQGAVSETRSRDESWYSLRGDGKLIRMLTTKVDDGVETRRELRQRGKTWQVITTVGDRVETRTVDAPIPSLKRDMAEDQWLKSNPKPGATWTSFTIDLEKPDINDPQNVTYQRRETRVYSGMPTLVHVLSVLSSGVTSEMIMLNHDVFLEARIGDTLRMVAEDERLARQLGDKVVDFSQYADVPITTDLGPEPGLVDRLELELRAPAEVSWMSTHRQQPTPGPDGTTILTLTRDFRQKQAAPLAKDLKKRLTEPETGIESNDKSIVALARRITARQTSTLGKAEALQSWIYKELEKTVSKNASSAIQILKQRAGDCTEHARLFVAFARALGIPAREVGGLIYVNEGRPRFVWHAWAEFHDGHQWTSVDAAWNQVNVDATHIRVSQGSDDLGWIHMLGTLKVSVKSFEARKKASE